MQAAGCSWESTDFPSHAAGEFEAEHCTAWGVIVKGLGSCTTEQLPKVDLISLPLRKGKSWSDQSLILDPKDLCPARKYSSGWFRNHFDILANGSLKQDKGIELCKDLWSHLPTGTRWFFFLPLLKALRPEVILLFLQTQTNTSVGSLTSQTNPTSPSSSPCMRHKDRFPSKKSGETSPNLRRFAGIVRFGHVEIMIETQWVASYKSGFFISKWRQ